MAPPTATQQIAIPPQPKSILRGHKAQIHAAAFVRDNERLLTGDADGFVVTWDLTIMRPRAVWQAHQNAVLGVAGWGSDKIITHGRDNKLVVWKLAAHDEAAMSTTLPLDPAAAQRTKPWMLHLLEVNTMNFCAFAFGPTSAPLSSFQMSTESHSDLLIAVPNTLLSEAVDIYHLPSQDRVHVVKLGGDHGMAMALALLWLNNLLTLVVGYEDGMATVAQMEADGSWFVIYRNQSHKQPVLSLDVAPSHEYFLTSSADAAIVKHPLLPRQASTVKGLIGNSPETVGPTDNRMSQIVDEAGKSEKSPEKGKSVSLLAAALASQPSAKAPRAAEKRQIQTEPLKVIDTKHSGQQSLRLRSDGRIFATAGWDSKIRVYAAKTMREVAVLKWHPVGCFAAAFANVTAADTDHVKTTTNDASEREVSRETSVVTKVLDMTVKDRRIAQAKSAHWLAAGSKDGKVSLWDIF